MAGTQRWSIAGWAIAGVPIVGTFFQALFALLAIEARLLPVVGGVVSAIISLDVFQEAAILFKSRPTVAVGLFVLVTVAWIGEGVAMIRYRNRNASFAFAGLVSILFLFLFVGVYFPLFGRDVAVAELALFYTVPVIGSLGAIGAPAVHDWEIDLEEAAATTLSAAEDAIERKCEEFESAFDRRVGEDVLEAFADLVPEVVADARESYDARIEEYESIREEIRATRTERIDPADLRTRATELRERADRRDPEEEVRAIEDALAARLRESIERDETDVTVRSRYGRTYDLVNLPTTFREVRLRPDGEATHIREVDRTFRSYLEPDGTDLPAVAAALSNLRTHRERIERHVERVEADFAEVHETAEENLETAREELERLDGEVRDRVETRLIEGQDPDVESVHDVEQRLESARDELHRCAFDEARNAVEDARRTSEAVLTTVQFVGSIAGALEYGQDSISVPSEVDPAVTRDLQTAFEREYGVEYRVEGSRLSVTSGGAVETSGESTTEATRDATGRTGTYVDPETVVDEVLLILSELRDRADSGSRTVSYDSGELPEYVATEGALRQFEAFCRRQTDIVDSLEVQSDAPPGFVDVRFTDRADAPTALSTLYDRFRDQYADG